MEQTMLKYQTLSSGTTVFYREASGPPSAPILLLLHGYPSSSHQYRNLIPLLAKQYRVVAPDLPGFGFTTVPASYEYTFANMTETIAELLDALQIRRFAMYVFDYGAPVGFRLALQRPGAISAIVTQNGNAYEEGLGARWSRLRELWAANGQGPVREAIKAERLTFEAVKAQYTIGTRDPTTTIAPEAVELDYALLSRPDMADAYIDMFYDYRTNVAMYPQFQEYFRASQVPLLAAWGRNDISFIPAGAESFKRDLPKAEIKLLDAGHFAAETNTDEIAELMLAFLRENDVC